MNSISARAVLLSALAYTLLNQLWLAGGNAGWIAESQRGLVKGASLLIAAGVFLIGVIATSRRSTDVWIKPTVVTAGLGVGLGFTLILVMSMIWYRGQFFHDSDPIQRAPVLLTWIFGAIVGAGVLAAIVGYLARAFWRPLNA